MIQQNADISTISSQASMSRLQSLAHTRNNTKEIEKVAGEFETMCYTHMIKTMFETTEDSAIWGESHASGIFRSMFIDAIAQSGGASSLKIKSAIAKSLYDQADTEDQKNQPRIDNFGEDWEAIDVLL